MIQDIFYGILSYFKAFSFAARNGLLRYFFLSGIIGVGLMVVIGALVWIASEPLSSYFFELLSFSWLPADFLLWTIKILLYTISFILFKYIYMVVLSPIMGPLSNKVDSIIKGELPEKQSKTQFIKDLMRGIYLALRNLLRELFFTTVILLLGLILPFLSFLIPVFLFVLQSYYAGFGNLDYYMEGKYTSQESVRLIKRNRGMAIGNGIPFIGLLLIPFLGVGLALPLATIAGTLEMNEKGY